MTEDKVLGAGGWSAIDKGANLFVGSTDPDFERPDLDLIVGEDLRGMMFDQTHLFLVRDHTHRLHGFFHVRAFSTAIADCRPFYWSGIDQDGIAKDGRGNKNLGVHCSETRTKGPIHNFCVL